MREVCLAIIDRVGARRGPAVERAKSAGCIFCTARSAPTEETDNYFVILSGRRAGEVYHRYERLPAESDLVSALPLGWPPDWFPGLALRDAFVIDELAVWFGNRALSTGVFVWRDADFDEIIRTIWEKRIPVSVNELVEILAAHGLPAIFHTLAADRFEKGLRLLIVARARAPIAKRRLNSFENSRDNPKQWLARFSPPTTLD